MNLSRALTLVICATPCAAQTLVAHYKLNETTGTVCADSSGNGQDGLYRNSFVLGQAAPAASCGTAVEFDAAASTDVIIPGGPALQNLTSDLTLSAWIYPTDLPASNAARRVFGNNNNGWMCGIHGDGLIFTTRFIQDYLTGGLGLTAQTWTHIAFVFDANFDVTFYVNGANVAFVPGGGPANSPNPDWFIGGFNGSIEFWNGRLDDVQVYAGALDAASIAALFNTPCSTLGGGSIGTNYCSPNVANSTGLSGEILATGSDITASNDVMLTATQLPMNQFGYFLNSMTQGFNPMPGGSQGNLCLAGALGRYYAIVFNTGNTGDGSLVLDLTMTPTPTGPVSVLPGEAWNFQCWYRDLNPAATSNFTDAVAVAFL